MSSVSLSQTEQRLSVLKQRKRRKKKNEIRDVDFGAGESGWYNGEGRRVIVARGVQGGRRSSTHRPNWVRLTHSVPIHSSVFLLPTCRLLGCASQPCPCHCSWRFSLGCRHLSRCHLFHLLPGISLSLSLSLSLSVLKLNDMVKIG